MMNASIFPEQMDFTTPSISNFPPNFDSGELSFVSLHNGLNKEGLLELQCELGELLCKSNRETDNEDVLFSDVAVQPNYWISKWVNSNNYGLGYQLCDDTVGVMFRDGTMLIKTPDKNTLDFYDSTGKITEIVAESPASSISLKMQIFAHTQNYMATYLAKTCAENSTCKDPLLPRPYLHTFWQLKNATIMYLNDGTLQLNFLDHIKVILCMAKQSITLIDENKRFQSYQLSTLQQEGWPLRLHERLNYTMHVIDEMLQAEFN